LRPRSLLLLAGLFAAALAGLASAQVGFGSRRAVLYEYPDFQGRSYTVYGGNRGLGPTGFEDRAMSARLEGAWTLCEHDDFQGRCETASGEVRHLGRLGLGGSVSSLRQASGDGGWGGRAGNGRRATLYEFPNYQGRSYTVYGGDRGLGPTGFEDRAMSGEFEGSWMICEHDDFQGRCETVSGAVRDLDRLGMGRTISSLRAGSGGGGGGGPRPGPGPGPGGRSATLFEYPNFQGRSYTVYGGNRGLGPTGFEDLAMSGRFDGDWIVCEHDDYQGRCQGVSGEVRNLDRIGLGHTISSLRAVAGRY
jgi:hypothetical protein